MSEISNLQITIFVKRMTLKIGFVMNGSYMWKMTHWENDLSGIMYKNHRRKYEYTECRFSQWGKKKNHK